MNEHKLMYKNNEEEWQWCTQNTYLNRQSIHSSTHNTNYLVQYQEEPFISHTQHTHTYIYILIPYLTKIMA